MVAALSGRIAMVFDGDVVIFGVPISRSGVDQIRYLQPGGLEALGQFVGVGAGALDRSRQPGHLVDGVRLGLTLETSDLLAGVLLPRPELFRLLECRAVLSLEIDEGVEVDVQTAALQRLDHRPGVFTEDSGIEHGPTDGTDEGQVGLSLVGLSRLWGLSIRD
jgi:hypothetical protein